MRVLFVTENFPPETNAAATRVFERALYWVRDGHEVTVITCAPNFPHGKLFPGYANRWRQIETMAGLRVVRVKTFIAPNKGVFRRTLDFLSFMISGWAAGLFERRADVVCVTSPQFFAAIGAWGIAKLRRVPFVFELGDLWPASIVAVGAMRPNVILRLLERVELGLYKQAAAVVALTGSFKTNLVSRGIPPNKIAVVINGVDLDRYGPRSRDPALATEWNLQDAFVVGYVGTHGQAHALGNVLDAAERVRDVPRLRFLLAGAGSARDELIAESNRRGLDNVVFLPPQPKESMPAVWSLCDVALIHLKNTPAFAEVIPSKIFEAMGMGLPLLVAAPDGEATRIVAEADAGLAIAPEDPAALAEAARRLMDDPALRDRLAQASNRAAPGFTRRRQADSMMAVLTAVVAGRGDSAAGAPATVVKS